MTPKQPLSGTNGQELMITPEAEVAALRALLEERSRGAFIGMTGSRKRLERMIKARKAGQC